MKLYFTVLLLGILISVVFVTVLHTSTLYETHDTPAYIIDATPDSLMIYCDGKYIGSVNWHNNKDTATPLVPIDTVTIITNPSNGMYVMAFGTLKNRYLGWFMLNRGRSPIADTPSIGAQYTIGSAIQTRDSSILWKLYFDKYVPRKLYWDSVWKETKKAAEIQERQRMSIDSACKVLHRVLSNNPVVQRTGYSVQQYSDLDLRQYRITSPGIKYRCEVSVQYKGDTTSIFVEVIPRNGDLSRRLVHIPDSTMELLNVFLPPKNDF